MNSSKDPIIQSLNPADYLTLAMDEEIRQENMPGSLCGFALVLDSLPDVIQLTARISEFTEQFPLALASLQQQGDRFHWCQRTQPFSIFFQHKCADPESAGTFQQTTLLTLLNQQQPRETLAPLEFHLISDPNNTVFLLRWIHPFCDAKGADLILKYLCTEDKAQRTQFDLPKSESLVNVHLAKYKWWQKIALFLKAKRYITRLDSYHSIQHADLSHPPKQLNCITHTFSAEQSGVIAQQVRSNVGLTGTSLYYIGCLIRALHGLAPEQAGDAYCVPYAFNLRKQNVRTPLLGNHIGTLFAQAPKTVIANRIALFTHLKQQNKETIQQQLDYAFLPIMWAASWLSLKKYGSELRVSHGDGSERSSVWFSDIGQAEFVARSFFGADVVGLRHLCQISSPPGIALLVCQYRQQLTLSYNFIEPLFNEAQIEQLHQLMSQELLGAAS
ncbi:MAG: hypothetical protein HOP02_00035 [Methylococcaceae bacterium]|nr:hypothetical protein [Methylococcaceae bacterium]